MHLSRAEEAVESPHFRGKPSPPLPADFSDLNCVLEWALPSFDAHFAKRGSSSQEELEAAYAVLFPRAKAMMAYCERFPFDEMPPEGRTLMNLLYSLATMSFAVEVWKRPWIPDSGTTYLNCVSQPVI